MMGGEKMWEPYSSDTIRFKAEDEAKVRAELERLFGSMVAKEHGGDVEGEYVWGYFTYQRRGRNLVVNGMIESCFRYGELNPVRDDAIYLC